jgi:hypothetical protein
MAPVDEDRPARKEASLAELVERLSGRFTTALVLAAAILGLAIYSRPSPPRYEAVVGDGKVVRIDRRSGTIIACDADGCATVLRKGQRLERNRNRQPALKAPAAPAPVPAAPAPTQ